MILRKSPFVHGTTAILMVVAAAIVALAIGTAINAYAQNTTIPPAAQQQQQQNQTSDPQQIKNYLNQAMQALDSGNNTKALEQVDLAEDQLESLTGTESIEDDDEEEEGEIEEGPGEDEDEPGDIDTNDEEDTP
jgi:cytoskeletal protein RodZ